MLGRKQSSGSGTVITITFVGQSAGTTLLPYWARYFNTSGDSLDVTQTPAAATYTHTRTMTNTRTDTPTPLPNSPPQIVSPAASPSWIVEYCRATLTAVALDPDGDDMEPLWSAPEGGLILGTGWMVEFKASGVTTARAFPLRLVVVDEHGAESAPVEVHVLVRVAGDVTGDNRVNHLGLAVFSAAYRTSVGGPCYDENADFDRNGVVDVYDLTILSTNYGR